MRKLALVLVLLAVQSLFASTRSVTADQLEAMLAGSRGKGDAKLAQQLSGLVLTERWSASRMARWQEKLPGPESRRALVVLADLSLFLPLPAAEVPATGAPPLTAQRELIAAAVNYAEKTIHQLPNFSATRDTIHFEDSPPTVTGMNRDLVGSMTSFGPLHAVSRSTATVVYRDGNEVDEVKAAKAAVSSEKTHGLTTWGEFGPILATVLVDAAHGKLAWSRWEHGPNGPLLVFRFEIPTEQSHYQVKFCCGAGGEASALQQYTGYHGEMGVDPIDGSILRLMIQADLKPQDKITRADILVEYGTVQIAGKAYICPLRSVSVAKGPITARSRTFSGNEVWSGAELTPVPADVQQTSLNDVAFKDYHVFRADSRVLSGKEAASIEDKAGQDLRAEVAGASVTPPAENPAAATPGSASATPTAADAGHEPAAPEAAADKSSGQKTTAPVPEISEANSPATPDIPSLGTPEKAILRVTTRLVEVGVVALDKKGRPVTDLKPEDFEIYDNGQKQVARFFTPPGRLSAPDLAASSPQASSPDELVYSNHRAGVASGGTAGDAAKESSSTIILIDGNHLSFQDLSFTRGQVLRFLAALSASERVGLYVQNAGGFQVLAEPTSDHAAVAARMSAWVPNAQAVARAQDEETRNRQQIDEVIHLSDMAYVNGNQNPSGQPEVMVDPQLRDLGDNPSRSAMVGLVSVARHLSPVPGHKNLVWIASENVLVDWADKAIGIEKGGKHNDAFVLRAQEALNDAHVSVYPLDASRLETMAVDPSLQHQAVEVSPSVQVPQSTMPQGGQAGAGLGRQTSEMQQDTHPIQAAIQQMAEATGGRIFRRGGDLIRNLNSVVDEGSAAYLLGFTPSMPADDQYHSLRVKLTTRRNVVLRYRTGYQYLKEPATMKDRFRRAVWQANDAQQIALSASPLPAYGGIALRLNIAAGDLELNRQGDRWMDKVDVFVVRRSAEGFIARVTGRTLALAFAESTYENLKDKGIPFEQFVEKASDTGSIRILVVDQNSGRIGSITIPASNVSQ
jgi:VWFA-related protein